MALGKTHRKLNLIIAWPLGLFLLFYFLKPHWYYYFVYSFGFFINTFILNPDLDLAHKVSLKTLRGWIHLPFYPYSFFFSHRGISHSLSLGTLSRVLYLIFLVSFFIIFFLGSYKFQLFLSFMEHYWHFVLILLVTFYYADFFHILVDKVSDRFP